MSPLKILMRWAGGVFYVEKQTGINYRTLYRIQNGEHSVCPKELLNIIAPALKKTPAQLIKLWKEARKLCLQNES